MVIVEVVDNLIILDQFWGYFYLVETLNKLEYVRLIQSSWVLGISKWEAAEEESWKSVVAKLNIKRTVNELWVIEGYLKRWEIKAEILVVVGCVVPEFPAKYEVGTKKCICFCSISEVENYLLVTLPIIKIKVNVRDLLALIVYVSEAVQVKTRLEIPVQIFDIQVKLGLALGVKIWE